MLLYKVYGMKLWYLVYDIKLLYKVMV